MPEPLSLSMVPSIHERPTAASAVPPARREWTRRRAITAGTAVGAATLLGGRILGLFGGSMPAEAGGWASCDTTILWYWTNGTNGPCDQTLGDDLAYAKNDDCGGCDRVERSPFYCESVNIFGSRHRTCGEDAVTPNGTVKKYKLRMDACWSHPPNNPTAFADGWQWWTNWEGGCGCANGRKQFSCNDGFYTVDNWATPVQDHLHDGSMRVGR